MDLTKDDVIRRRRQLAFVFGLLGYFSWHWQVGKNGWMIR